MNNLEKQETRGIKRFHAKRARPDSSFLSIQGKFPASNLLLEPGARAGRLGGWPLLPIRGSWGTNAPVATGVHQLYTYTSATIQNPMSV